MGFLIMADLVLIMVLERKEIWQDRFQILSLPTLLNFLATKKHIFVTNYLINSKILILGTNGRIS